jgi:hypothetical protein
MIRIDQPGPPFMKFSKTGAAVLLALLVSSATLANAADAPARPQVLHTFL